MKMHIFSTAKEIFWVQ